MHGAKNNILYLQRDFPLFLLNLFDIQEACIQTGIHCSSSITTKDFQVHYQNCFPLLVYQLFQQSQKIGEKGNSIPLITIQDHLHKRWFTMQDQSRII